MIKTILLVEDEKRMLNLLKLLFTSNGFHVLTAGDGEEGLRVFTSNFTQINLVISDIGLPKLTGDAMFSEMKKVDPNIKLIFASGEVDQEIRIHLLQLGVIDFISKPFDTEHLIKRVVEITSDLL